MEELFESRRPEYTWRIELPPWAPKAGIIGADRRADDARFHFDFWKILLDEGLFDYPDLFCDAGRGFFRFSDGIFALSPERANWPALKEAGLFTGWGPLAAGDPAGQDATVGTLPPPASRPLLPLKRNSTTVDKGAWDGAKPRE